MEPKLRSEPTRSEVSSEVRRFFGTLQGLANLYSRNGELVSRSFEDGENTYIANLSYNTITREGVEASGWIAVLTRGPIDDAFKDIVSAIYAENGFGSPFLEEIAFGHTTNTREAMENASNLLSDFIGLFNKDIGAF